jgi:2,4-dienoyl-CoA reductase-like NADH-dependent reductase (Old Yellow Enzyme family)
MSVLFEPLRIGSIEIKNRFVRSATYYGLSDDDGYVGERSVELMRTLTRNEVGLIISGYAFVAKSGQVFADMNGIDADDQIPGYRKMTDAVHELDGHIVMQIAHGGIASMTAARRRGDCLAVSTPIRPPPNGAPPRQMTDADIEAIVEDFGRAAARVEEAGFDGVQIHGAHGYLVTQFLSPKSNRRTDRWGGSLENRMRFVVEVVRAMRRNVALDFPITIKLGCRDYLDEGTGLGIDEGAHVAAELQAEGVCFIEVSHGIGERSFRKVSRGTKTTPIVEAYLVPDVRVVRRATSVPLSVVGGMRSLPVIEEVVASGVADCVSIARPLIREPDLIRRWRQGDTRPSECLSCFGCMKTDSEGRSEIRCRQREGEGGPDLDEAS